MIPESDDTNVVGARGRSFTFVEAFSGRFPECEKGKCKRKLSDYLMRGGLYIEIGFEYKEIFSRLKKKKKAQPLKVSDTIVCS